MWPKVTPKTWYCCWREISTACLFNSSFTITYTTNTLLSCFPCVFIDLNKEFSFTGFITNSFTKGQYKKRKHFLLWVFNFQCNVQNTGESWIAVIKMNRCFISHWKLFIRDTEMFPFWLPAICCDRTDERNFEYNRFHHKTDNVHQVHSLGNRADPSDMI